MRCYFFSSFEENIVDVCLLLYGYRVIIKTLWKTHLESICERETGDATTSDDNFQRACHDSKTVLNCYEIKKSGQKSTIRYERIKNKESAARYRMGDTKA